MKRPSGQAARPTAAYVTPTARRSVSMEKAPRRDGRPAQRRWSPRMEGREDQVIGGSWPGTPASRTAGPADLPGPEQDPPPRVPVEMEAALAVRLSLGRPCASTGRHLRNLPPDQLTTDAAVRLVRRTTLVHAHHPRRRRLNSGSTKRPEARAPGPSPARHKNAPHGQAGQGSAVGWLALAGVDSV